MKIITTSNYIADDGESFNTKQACVDHEKIVTDGGIYLDCFKISEEKLREYLSHGYWLTNYNPGRLAIFGPPPMNGQRGMIYGAIAEELGKHYDRWNYDIYQRKATE